MRLVERFLLFFLLFLLTGPADGQEERWVDDGRGDQQLCDNRRPCPTGENGLCGWYDDGCGGRYCETCQCTPETDQQMCARLEKGCEGDDLALPPRLVARGDDNCGVYREVDCSPCAETERIYVTEPDPGSVVPFGGGKTVVDHALILAREGVTRNEVNALAEVFGARVIGQFPATSVYQLAIPAQTIDDLLEILERLEKARGSRGHYRICISENLPPWPLALPRAISGSSRERNAAPMR